MNYSDEQIQRMNRTSRYSGAVCAANALCYKHLDFMLRQGGLSVLPDVRILDYGCGKNGGVRAIDCITRYPRVKHYMPYDIGANAMHNAKCPGTAVLHRIRTKTAHPDDYFHLVILSNVLNVQETPEQFAEVLADAWSMVADDGWLLVNYPTQPRKTKVSNNKFSDLMHELPDCFRAYCPLPRTKLVMIARKVLGVGKNIVKEDFH